MHLSVPEASLQGAHGAARAIVFLLLESQFVR